MNYLQRLISTFSSPLSSEQPAKLPNALSPGKHIELGSCLYMIVGLKNNDKVLLITPYIMDARLVSVEHFTVRQVKACTTIVLYAVAENHIKEFHEQLSKLFIGLQGQVSASSNG